MNIAKTPQGVHGVHGEEHHHAPHAMRQRAQNHIRAEGLPAGE